MKIAVVLNTSWNIYNFRMGLIKALQAQGHSICCVAPHDEFTSKLKEAGCEFSDIKMDSRGVNPVKDFLLFFELKKIYKKQKPDIILHYTVKPNIYGTLAAKSLGIPVINNVCGLGSSFIRGGVIAHIVQSLYRFSFLFASKVFFQNPDDHHLFVSKKLLREEKTDIVPGSGIDLNYFSPRINDNNDNFSFLMISRVIKDKGVFEFVEAAKTIKGKYPKVKFKLLGALDDHHIHGIPKETLTKWVTEGTIEYLGTTEDVRPYISESDCVVLPSYREGTPRTLLEAAGMGKPLITTDTPGCRQVVEDGHNGWLCKSKNADDLTNKIEKVLSASREDLIKWGENSLLKAKKEFSEEIVIEKYKAQIQQLALSN
ncbi:MAG: glycosyltransferase family 4 protein [Cyclobacteriaceae bacterium]|nr:glycosyltransferase family 4 protein [Cyclobacteriaceae bacterium]